MRRGFLGGAVALTLTTMMALGAVVAHSAPRLDARFDRDSVGVGEHITLSVEVEQDMMQMIAFPEFDDENTEYLEQVTEPTLDTLSSDGRRVKIRRQYRFRSFEPGRYNMGKVSVLYLDKNVTDTLYTADSLRFTVGMFRIDSTSQSIYDLKPQRDLPFKFEEVSTYALWVAIGLLLLIVAAYITLRILAKMGHSVFGIFKPKPPVAPHVAAFAALEELRTEQLWQAGEYKGYYSRLTDILRTYISGRYGVAAMEMTSPEIIAASKELDLPRRCEMELQELLRDADLVKFAKAQFEASENERYFQSAKAFVELTKPEDEQSEDGEVTGDETAAGNGGETAVGNGDDTAVETQVSDKEVSNEVKN